MVTNSFITYIKSKYKTEVIYMENDPRPWLGVYQDNKITSAILIS